jgi:hypothetical protein
MQESEIQATGIPPTNDFEAAIDATLAPGSYTAVVKGKNGASGVALVEVYDLDPLLQSKMANIVRVPLSIAERTSSLPGSFSAITRVTTQW